MKYREPTSAPTPGASTALPCLALLLLPLMAVARAWCRPNLNVEVGLTPLKPYLAVLGSPPLRIEEAIPPPDLTTRPSAAAPPQPDVAADNGQPARAPAAADATDSAGSASPTAAASSSTSAVSPAPATDRGAVSDNSTSSPTVASSPADQPADVHTPAPILPDETRPQVRPEDFLPYFQIPATQPGDPNVIVPVPRQTSGSIPVPPSSATYTQTPR